MALDPATAEQQAPTAEALIGARYRDGAIASGPWNEVLATILAHRSVRAYLPDPLPAGTLECLVAAAQSASTSSNLQTWSVVAVEDPTRKARLAELASGQKHIVQCPLYLVWCVDLARLRLAAEERQIVLEGLDYLEPFIVGVVDAALAAQSAAIALESLGLGFVLIGAMRNHPEAVAAELGLPPHVMALFGMCVGYPDPAVPTADQAAPAATRGAAPRTVFGRGSVRGFHRIRRVPQSLSARAADDRNRLDPASDDAGRNSGSAARPRPHPPGIGNTRLCAALNGRMGHDFGKRGISVDHHDWHSPSYVDQWITRDVTRDEERRVRLRQMLAAAPFAADAEIAVLDVGGGYGVVTEEVLRAFPARPGDLAGLFAADARASASAARGTCRAGKIRARRSARSGMDGCGRRPVRSRSLGDRDPQSARFGDRSPPVIRRLPRC